jgi:putative heme transporter
MRVPRPVAHRMGDRVLESLRGYFLGVTIVAAFNAVVVGAGALILGVPLAGTIAAITFLGAYIPYLGAWGAGAFAVLIALGGAGTDAALGMIVIQLLANGILQQMIQPIAYGAALGIHPLAMLIVTIGGRRPVRRGGADPRGAAHLRRHPHCCRPVAKSRRVAGGPAPARRGYGDMT